ncbi:MAG TPA: prolipoprotein diacylglyceryl transferase [Dehalococcoidia bacterium]|nr:prolipoprotein diacylglyceryl transferase [Dehalococcoidia bacterium]
MISALVLLSIKIGIDPTILDEAGIEITWHGVFTAVGVIMGVAVSTWFARRAGYNEDTIYNVALCLVIGGIIGARSLYVIENWGDFKDNLGDVFAVNTGGISIYGALIGGAIGAWLYVIIRRVPNIPKAADIACIGGILGMAVGRIGDIINGEHFAKTTDLPWAVVYTHDNSPSVLRFGANYAQHPAVAYELLGDLLIFAILIFMYTRISRSGVTFFAWVFLYGLLRFWVSFLRLDDEVLGTGLRTAQLIGLGGIVAGLLGVAYMLRFPPREERTSRAERRRALRDEQPPGAEEHPAS